LIGLTPAAFYDMTFREWYATVAGFERTLPGGTGPTPATSEDFAAFDDPLAPSPSIRD
jgi:hypothetical protein